jgi:hypothetical protein
MNGQELAKLLDSKGYKTKNVTKTSLIVLVSGNRLKEMVSLTEELNTLGAKIDRSLRASSIGGIVVGKVKIYIKSDGRGNGTAAESAAIEEVNDAIMIAMANSGGPITVRIGRRHFNDVVGVRKTFGTPKSDFHLIDSKGKELAHISHKKGHKPSDFQQWSGVTEKEIAQHKEVIEFGEKYRARFGDKIKSGESTYAKIKDKHLMRMAVYGVNYNKGGVNKNRVDAILQGNMVLKKVVGNTYELSATGHVNYLDSLPRGGYEPVLAMIYKGDRTNLGVQGGRASIYPFGGRRFKEEIK